MIAVLRGLTGAGWLLAVSCAVGHGALKMPDDGAGPTCEHYMPMGRLAWMRRGGDWIDAAGTAHGSRPYATEVVA